MGKRTYRTDVTCSVCGDDPPDDDEADRLGLPIDVDTCDTPNKWGT